MLRVALTGNIASGKSVVASIWQRLGACIIDADELARLAVMPGSPALDHIATQFGTGVLQSDGSLDRATLRQIVFADDRKRADLEAILHPEIQRLRQHIESDLAARGEAVVVHVIPLLFEVGLADEFDEVILVDAPESTRLERLMSTRGLSLEEAQNMVAAQMPSSAKRAHATRVIENDGTLADLERKATAVWQSIRAQAQAC
jgi:dephospho-CoA kinase